MQCLLNLLRGQDAGAVDTRSELDELLDLADEEHILPWVAHLYSRQASIPSDLRDRLHTIERDAAIKALRWSSELKIILFAFEQRDIKVVPLKGPFLAQRFFGDVALRTNYDLDLLVSKHDLPRAEHILAAIGFDADVPDDYHREWRKGGTIVELHHDVENPLAFDFHTAHVLQRVDPTVFQGVRCWQLAPRDELLFLCLHAARHAFGRVSLMVDLCFAFEKLSLADEESVGFEMAEHGSLLLLGLAMARHLRPDITRTLLLDAPLKQRQHLESISDRLWDRLLTRPSDLLDWRALHSFYLQIDLPQQRLGRRFRHLRILLGRVIKPDYEFAARMGFHRVWQARLLRPVRLVLDVLWNTTKPRQKPSGTDED